MRIRGIVIGVLLALVVAPLFAHKTPFRLYRPDYRSYKMWGMGGTSSAYAPAEDIFSQNPALLYSHTASSKRLLYYVVDEDAIFLGSAARKGTYLPLPTISFNASFFTERLAVVSFFSNFGLNIPSIFSSLPDPFPLYLAPVTALFTPTETLPLSDSFSALTGVRLDIPIDMLVGPVIPSRNFGAMLRTHMYMGLDFSAPFSGILPFPRITLKAEAVFETAFATRLPMGNRFHFGLGLRFFARGIVDIKSVEDIVAIADAAGSTNTDFIGDLLSGTIDTGMFTNLINGFMTNITGGSQSRSAIDALMTPIETPPGAPYYSGRGISIDLGMLWRVSQDLHVGFVLQDVYSPIRWSYGETERLPINLKVGAAYYVPWKFKGFIEDIVLILDIDDLFFRRSDNFILKTHLGAHASVFNDFADIYVGLNQGYPCFTLIKTVDFMFLKETPFLKGFYPDRYVRLIPALPFPLSLISDLLRFPAYVPVIIPFSAEDVRRMATENLVTWLFGWAANIALHMTLDITVGTYGYEEGLYPGAQPVGEFFLWFAIRYEGEE